MPSLKHRDGRVMDAPDGQDKLLAKLSAKYGDIYVKNDNFNVMVSLNANMEGAEVHPQLTRDNWKDAFAAQLAARVIAGETLTNDDMIMPK